MAPGELRRVEDDEPIDLCGGQVHGASSCFLSDEHAGVAAFMPREGDIGEDGKAR